MPYRHRWKHGGEDSDALAAMAQYSQVHIKVAAFYALGRKRSPDSDLGPMVRRDRLWLLRDYLKTRGVARA
jgi:hypothetical protein